jgi:dTDP-4-dehydrorhamnose reductase
MRVLLTGAAGQLGQILRQQCPPGVELIASSRSGGEGLIPLDLADPAACRAAIAVHRPDWVLNAGAYTAVDRAEVDAAEAWAVNAGAPRAFAEALAERSSPVAGGLLQLSTDFVFSGRQGSPYRPEQPCDPLGVYGASKAAAEQVVLARLGAEGNGAARGLILRTSWLMGPVGRNFAQTMLRLHREHAGSDQPLRVVADQVGCPTSTLSLAAACWRVLQRCCDPSVPSPRPRILHWSDAGAASWYDVAVAVGELAVELGLLRQGASVQPITTADYPTPAQRPSYSLLDCSQTRRFLDLQPHHWRQALRQLLCLLR